MIRQGYGMGSTSQSDAARYDVIVVGAGAAGLLAAGEAAAQGARTLLLEKMDRPGRKLSITGMGRCNLPNSAPLSDFIRHFSPNGRFLKPGFHAFFADDLIRFLNDLNIPTVTERGGRVFPASGDAQEIVAGLLQWVHGQGVTLQNRVSVEKLLLVDGHIEGVQVAHVAARTSRGGAAQKSQLQTYHAPAVILATGGGWYPGTGSTGDGYRLAAAAGHSIVPIRPALVPLETAGDVARQLEDLNLKNVAVSLWVDGKKQAREFGEMLFTRFGLSGPVILTLSRQVVDALINGAHPTISIDLKPALDDQKLDDRLLRDIDQHGKQPFATLLKELLPRDLIPVCVQLTGIRADKLAHQITAQERKRLRLWLKDFRLEVTRYRPFSEAIITAGGVSTQEVDPASMQSRLVKGLYFAGEVLDFDADTGGYNLQAAFSTGWLAGRSAARQG